MLYETTHCLTSLATAVNGCKAQTNDVVRQALHLPLLPHQKNGNNRAGKRQDK
jgi:hypothetical protein